MARPELPGAAVPIQPPVSPFRWAARTRFSSLLPKCSFIFRMVVVYWSWNCESCPEIKYFSLFLRTALLFQLIPARGRKHEHPTNLNRNINISTYPRKGTETRNESKPNTVQPISTYPRKGTETSMGFAAFASKLIFQLIPARGRKRHRQSYHSSESYNFNLSPQGDGNWNTPE